MKKRLLQCPHTVLAHPSSSCCSLQQREAREALKANGSELVDLGADDLLPLLTYVIASSRAFADKPYTSLQFIRELAYRVRCC
jgi:hypothetical protein